MNGLALEQRLKEIIQEGEIQTYFQPIVDTRSKQVLGYEALSRGPSDSSLFPAGRLFEAAERAGLQEELEYECRVLAAKRFNSLSPGGLLFINISPNSLNDHKKAAAYLEQLPNELNIEPHRIVLELSERYPTENIEHTSKVLTSFKELGFSIAIDDLGTGYSGLKLWSQVKPDFVKLDRHFICDIDSDLVKHEFVSRLCDLANGLGCKLIAEGVETEGEYKAVHDLGIDICQGFYFGKPKPIPSVKNLDKTKKLQAGHTSIAKIGSLSNHITPATPETKMLEIAEAFTSNRYLSSIPIVKNGTPLGMISRWSLLELFSQTYGRSLHEYKPVKNYMAKDVITVSWDSDVSEVSRLLTGEEDLYVRQHFIITRDHQYIGLGSTRDVLKRITEMKIRAAKYANPLTQLPGNVPINETIAELNQSNQCYSLAYFDINYFKPYNDNYGYAKGDNVIQLLANILKQELNGNGDFIGHVGGDDFVVIFKTPRDMIKTARDLKASFDTKVKSLYPKDVATRGTLNAIGRNGIADIFPISSLSIAIVEQDMPSIPDGFDITFHAAKVKGEAKKSVSKIRLLKMSDQFQPCNDTLDLAIL
ncbi:GGDEF domain-containing protein [Teredinibacter haidensis]|uniref:GGDEF domain-containing protein n=1 Tax=Teredinibacter haidensis TaxID=2731755 RepID=UPI0009489BDE|nr:GGDEF domain-containing protein [Teredinibacter haidensis]